MPEVLITTTDINAATPGQDYLISGTLSYTLVFKTSGSWTVTATDVDGVGISHVPSASPSVSVSSNDSVKLQVIVPGETANPGNTSNVGTITALLSVVVRVTVFVLDVLVFQFGSTAFTVIT